MLNDQKIKDIISQYEECKGKNYYYFYGVITASFGKMMLLGSLASFANKYYIVGMNEDEVVIVGLNMLAKPNGYSLIKSSQIVESKISSWLFGLGKKITLKLEDGTKLKFKANKLCIGIKKQKENLKSIEKFLK